uniref:Uncharacterized protein n=1 Tax=Catharus ustulatus TaxID=91951 RepID=A0A8C3UWR4_CATUS
MICSKDRESFQSRRILFLVDNCIPEHQVSLGLGNTTGKELQGRFPPLNPAGRFPALNPPGRFPSLNPPGRFPSLNPPDRFPPLNPPGRFPSLNPPDRFPPLNPPGRFPPLNPPGRFPPLNPAGRFPALNPPGRFPALNSPGRFPPVNPPGRFPALNPPDRFPSLPPALATVSQHFYPNIAACISEYANFSSQNPPQPCPAATHTPTGSGKPWCCSTHSGNISPSAQNQSGRNEAWFKVVCTQQKAESLSTSGLRHGTNSSDSTQQMLFIPV